MPSDQLAVHMPDDPDGRVVHISGIRQPLRLHTADARLLHRQLGAVLDTIDGAPPTPVRGTISDKQRGYILALCGEYGISDRDNRLQALSRIVGRPVQSTNHLNAREASKVIETLKARLGHDDKAGAF